MTTLTLEGHPEGKGNEHRVTYLSSAIDNVEATMHHLDGQRQKNLTISLVVFAGLFGFGLRSQWELAPPFVAIALSLLTFVFCVLDRRLHRMNHGWRETRTVFMKRLADVINDPEADVTFFRYYAEAQDNAERWSLAPVIYYLLFLGSLLSWPVLYYATAMTAQ